MKIKSPRFFRQKYLTDVRHMQPNAGYNTNFMGCSHKQPDGNYVKGFFDLYHGDKGQVGGFLSNFLKIAEDGQAVYEFLQNAADCSSTLFYMFYNEKYFLAINNGNAFNQEGLRSLLNVAQSTKSTSSQIGRFGIGFKLVHRLVGKSDGAEELTKEYKGPIMFSWSREKDLISLMNHEGTENIDDITDDSPYPYLLKILLTNFPAGPCEKVKDLEYNDRIPFDDDEYRELCDYVSNCIKPYIGEDDFSNGSLFFIRLGEGKKSLLDKDCERNLKAGVEYSLNTLKGLDNVKINGAQIKKVPLMLKSGVIKRGSETFTKIDPEYKDDDIHYTIGINKIDFSSEHPFDRVDALKKSPTFYKYFPLGDEMHQSAVFIHCDSLSNEANRRKMHDDSINRELILEIAKFIVKQLKEAKEKNDKSSFCQLYANLLLSEVPHDNSDWLKGIYYDVIQDYIVSCIPTKIGYASNPDFVKIKRIKTEIPLSVVGDDMQWFEWDSKNVDSLVSAAKERLGIKSYDIVDLILDADIDRLNEWISSASQSLYLSFLNELNSTTRAITNNSKFKDKIRKIKLFKFSDEFLSWENVEERDKTIYNTNHVDGIKSVLEHVGCLVSEVNIDNYAKIKECFRMPKDKDIFSIIKSSLDGGEAVLSIADKKRLISHLCSNNPETKLEDVGEESIKKLRLCKNKKGESVPLCALLGHSYSVQSWLASYQISDDDYFTELERFLMPEGAIYRNIIFKQWNELCPSSDIKNFYAKVKRLYDIDSDNNKTLNGKKYIYTEDGEYVTLKSMLFNDKMLAEGLNYKRINNVITTIFKRKLPNKSIIGILKCEPFGLINENLCDWPPEGTSEVDIEDIKEMLKFCELNHESFFKEFVVNEYNGFFQIQARFPNHYQVYAGNAKTKSFIAENLCDSMIPLPRGLEEYKSADGVIYGQELSLAILREVEDVDEKKEQLIDVVKYAARKEFINRLSEVRISLNENHTRDSFEYKILDMACSVLSQPEEEEELRNKFVIEKDGETYDYDQIPQSVSEHIEVEGAKKEFELSKLLPDECCNASMLPEVIDEYSELGIPRDKLEKLLGTSEKADIDSIFNTLIENYSTLINSQQLAFVLQVCKDRNESLPEFKLVTTGGDSYNGDFFIKKFDFIADNYILADKYSDLKEYLNLPYVNNNTVYAEAPYIDKEGEFVCPGLGTEDSDGNIDFKKVIALLEYLKRQYKQKRNIFKQTNWSEIKNELGFEPSKCVFPAKYAIEEEQLPKAVEKWVKEDESNIEMIGALGVMTEDNPVMEFRKHMCNCLPKFENKSLRSIESEVALENSIVLLAEKNKFPLKSKEKFETLKLAIERINELRSCSGIEIYDCFDFEKMAENSTEFSECGYEDWKVKTRHSIYLYNGQLPHIVTIDEYVDGPIFSYCDGDIAACDEGIIYINEKSDKQEAMHNLASNNNIKLTREEVYELFNRSIKDLQDEIQKLKEENKRLKHGDVDISGSGDGVSEEERYKWNKVAREKVREKLESEGYEFTEGIRGDSIVKGVKDPDGNHVDLVVKSCKGGTLYIDPWEWETLLKPNAMLWAYNGFEVMPLHLRALISNQKKMVLSMDTRNVDSASRMSKFAQILKYFKQVKFEFDSLSYSATEASSHRQYAFDDRPMSEKQEVDEHQQQ